MNEINITLAVYVVNPKRLEDGNCSINATIDGIEMSVPLDPANRHYAAILAAVEAGTLTIAEADPLPSEEVSP